MKRLVNIQKIQDLQIIRYIMTGGVTTAINYIIYFGLTAVEADYITANCIAWLGAVIFAFFANKQLVFCSKGERKKEFIQFVSLRLATLAAETMLLYILVEAAGAGSTVSKILVSLVTVVLNYIACKYGIFKERRASHE